MRTSWVVLVLFLSTSPSFADEFGGWTFTAPAGHSRNVSGDHVAFQKITGTNFCAYTLFTARAPGASTDEDVAFEINNTISKNFTQTNVTKSAAKAKHLSYVAMSVTMTDADGDTFALTHYTLLPKGGVSTLIAAANTAAQLAKCPTKALLDSIRLTSAPASPTSTTTATATTPPPTGSIQVTGAWAGGSSAANSGFGDSSGSIKRQYTFNADGTYRHHVEAWGGETKNGFYFLRDEIGTYTISGDQLTITPSKATRTEIDENKKTKQVTNAPLETVTYAIQKHYFAGIQKWNLVMTTAKETDRDGRFSSSSSFPSSYLLADTYKPEWRYTP